MNPSETVGLRGIWPALLTPLREDLAIDHARYAAHGRSLLAAGCAGLTPFGTTGEGPSFSVAERCAAVDALVAGGVPAQRVLVSTSCAALPDVLALTRHALAIGAYGCMMTPPFFLKGVPDGGIADAFRYVIDRAADARLRLVLYHIPQVAGIGLSHGVVAALLREYPRTIVAIKDSGGDAAYSLSLADAFMPPIGVHVGHEPDLQALARRGSAGAVSGLANFVPRLVQRLVAAPDGPDAVRDQARVQRLLALLGGYALTPAFKAILAQRSGDAGWLRVRPPLAALAGARLDALGSAIRDFGIDPHHD